MTTRRRIYFPLTPLFDVDKRHGAIGVGNTPPAPFTELDKQIGTHVTNQNTYLGVTVRNGSVVVVGSHIRRTSSGTLIALAPDDPMTRVGAFSTLQANTVYDGSGVSRGSVAMFQATANSNGVATELVNTDHQLSAVSLPLGLTLKQSRLVVGQTDSVSASLNSAPSPSSTVWAMLFTGGAASTIAEPVPAGWLKLAYEEKIGGGGYWVRAGIYRSQLQTFSVTLEAGATSGGGWGVLMFEANV